MRSLSFPMISVTGAESGYEISNGSATEYGKMSDGREDETMMTVTRRKRLLSAR